MSDKGTPNSRGRSIKPPKGTRDLYPEDALRKRYVQQAWRDASIRCGFDEIAGPTFESTELYSVKSGEGILGELFQAYSGKSPDEVAQVQETGRAPYAMRPEFTPTLARMYAAKAGSLPRPCKWFTAGPYFRAERPQRGRLREFEQWNVDVIGLPGDLNAEDAENAEAKARMDAECVECCIACMFHLGLTMNEAHVEASDRGFIDGWAIKAGLDSSKLESLHQWLDGQAKRPPPENERLRIEYGIPHNLLSSMSQVTEQARAAAERGEDLGQALGWNERHHQDHMAFTRELLVTCINRWVLPYSTTVVRGLAYYTGTVFEVIAEGERAVAGGGRYDNLIELMGGPPTPAVGFAMGDVVLSLLLDDKGLMPEGAELQDAVSRAPASVRPDVFVVGADDDATDPLVRRLAADLRRGVESKRWSESDDRRPWARERYESATGGVTPLHSRVSYKSTRNLKKLLADGEKQFARFAAIVHGEDRVQLRSLDTRADLTPRDVPGMDAGIAEFSVSPEHPAYVGRAVAALS